MRTLLLYLETGWREPDSGIWEVRGPRRHFTHSKVMCWVALDRAIRLAERGELPSAHLPRWRHEAGAIRQYVDEQCWSDRLHSYTRVAGSRAPGERSPRARAVARPTMPPPMIAMS